MKRGFRITMVMADSEFAPLQTLLSELHEALTLNLTAANKHELLVECRIHVIKEQMRVVCHLLPFNTLPRKMTANESLSYERRTPLNDIEPQNGNEWGNH
jgi:hypothetical protein